MLELEYVKGGQLKRMFKKPLSDHESSKIMKNILEAVNYIHDRDYIHRDLKPENILMAASTGNAVKICDFGLSAKH